ncbi:MAG: hypothetical protein EA402_08480 [Planctomycetota bacterium]|nr:MAG: hypothetical protein EA402_08480 [Planctomycetota bacterium]
MPVLSLVLRLSPLVLALLSTLSAVESVRVSVVDGRAGPVLMVESPRAESASPTLRGQLRQQVTLRWQDLTVAEAVSQLQRSTGINLVLDPHLAEQAPPITLQMKEVSMASALDWLARLSGGQISLVGEAVWLGLKPYRGSVRRILRYDIADLSLVVPNFPGPDMALNAHGAQLRPAGLFAAAVEPSPRDRAEEIADIIRQAIGAEVR